LIKEFLLKFGLKSINSFTGEDFLGLKSAMNLFERFTGEKKDFLVLLKFFKAAKFSLFKIENPDFV
jgi:hypothetical protein